MRKANKTLALATIFASSLLTGCASWFFEGDTEERITDRGSEVRSTLETTRETMGNGRPFMATRAWVGGSMVYEPTRYDRLENERVRFSMNRVTLPEIAVRLSELTDLTVKLNSDLNERARDDSGSRSNAASGTSTDSTGE